MAGASIASMRAAMERGDVDEAARQGVLAGPVIIEAALAAPDRAARLAAIAAAPSSEGRAELLDALAVAASGGDRRVAIPAARAARTIARELAERELPDDIASADANAWRDRWAELAMRSDRWIELRVIALDTAAALDRAATPMGATPGIGIAIDAALADRDPAFRRAAIDVVPAPVPPALRAPLAKALASDTSNEVALAAANALCFDLVADAPAPIVDAIGAAGLERIKALVGAQSPASAKSRHANRDAKRCLTVKR
jgi:hypothetical protein